jgi:DDE superfamily endonuclease
VRKRHIVVLSEQERARLHTMIGRGVAPAGALTHARILLKANQGEAGPGWTDTAIGLDAAIYRKPPARQYRRRLDGEQEARLVALTCSAPPQGYKRRPQLCLDETSRQLLGEVNPPRPVAPGRPARHDYEYQRGGVCNLFLVAEPLRGWRHVMVSARRTRIDWAHCIRDLVEVHYPDAEQIVLVQDNLNTHTPASLYAAFSPAEARRLAGKLELHSTPKHGSWLNMAEIELAQQCLDRRLADRATLEREVAAWQAARNRAGRRVNWRFTTEDARTKLKRLYPTTQD